MWSFCYWMTFCQHSSLNVQEKRCCRERGADCVQVLPALEVLACLSVLPRLSVLPALPLGVGVALVPSNFHQLLELEYVEQDKLGIQGGWEAARPGTSWGGGSF